MITKSAKKAHRQNLRRREHNSKQKEALKKAVKNYKKLVSAGKLDDAKSSLPGIYKILDKTAKVGIIKKNKASRLKSRLSALAASGK